MPSSSSSSSTLNAPLTTGQFSSSSSSSSVPDGLLYRYNWWAFVVHLVQGSGMLVASQAVPSIKAFKKTVHVSFLAYDNATRALVPASKPAFDVEIGVAAAAFVLLSALAHGGVLLCWERYLRDINRGINRARWYEYALSSSVMICSIAVLFGCYDLGSLVLMFVVNAVMNLCGLLMEMLNPPDRDEVVWAPFVVGCLAGAAPWIVVLMYFFAGGNYSAIPGFVYGILGGYFVFFNTYVWEVVLVVLVVLVVMVEGRVWFWCGLGCGVFGLVWWLFSVVFFFSF